MTYVDVQIVDFLGEGKPETHTLYLDEASADLYRCIKNPRFESGTCDLVDPSAFKWEPYQVERGKKFGAKPVIRISLGVSYFLEAAEPFSQLTTFTYFQGPGKITRCRSTFTEYNFKFMKPGGQVLYFESAKEDRLTGGCERVFPHS